MSELIAPPFRFEVENSVRNGTVHQMGSADGLKMEGRRYGLPRWAQPVREVGGISGGRIWKVVAADASNATDDRPPHNVGG